MRRNPSETRPSGKVALRKHPATLRAPSRQKARSVEFAKWIPLKSDNIKRFPRFMRLTLKALTESAARHAANPAVSFKWVYYKGLNSFGGK